MPGVVINTAVRSGPQTAGEAISGQAFMVGTTTRGKASEPTLVRNLTQYDKYYGGYVSGNLYSHAQTYFEEGGSRLYIQRTVADDAVAGSRAATDSAGSTVATFTAADVGAWAANLDTQIVAGNISGVRVKVFLDDVLVLQTGDLATLDALVAAVNVGVPHLVTVAKESGASNMPAAGAAVAMSAGADGTLVTNGSATDNYVEALAKMPKDLGPGAVAIPGIATANSYWHALIDHAAANDRIALCAFTSANTDTGAKTAISGASPAIYTDADAEYAAFYYPWVKIPDPANAGLTISISPESYAAAKRSKATNAATGPWRVGAGIISEASFVTALSPPATVTMSKAVGDELDNARINAIRLINGRARIYGARSASNDESNWRFITARDSINHIVYECEKRLEDYVFSTIDGRGALFNDISASLIGILEPIRKNGGVYEAYDVGGTRIDPGYSVQVSNANNPTATLATGQVTADIAVRVSAVGDKITVNITKSNMTAGVL
jgi:hypothetical protein